MPLWGLLRDRIGWAATIVCGAVLNAAISAWFFNYLPTLGQGDSRLTYALILVGLGAGYIHALLPGLIASLFPTNVRQSGFALPYSIGTAVFTGLTPLLLSWLVRDYGLNAPMYQYLTACTVSLVIAATVGGIPKFLGEAGGRADALAAPAIAASRGL